jgi:hypothetical protein
MKTLPAVAIAFIVILAGSFSGIAQSNLVTVQCTRLQDNKKLDITLKEGQREVTVVFLETGLASTYNATFTAVEALWFEGGGNARLGTIGINYRLDRTTGRLYNQIGNFEPSLTATCKKIQSLPRLF